MVSVAKIEKKLTDRVQNFQRLVRFSHFMKKNQSRKLHCDLYSLLVLEYFEFSLKIQKFKTHSKIYSNKLCENKTSKHISAGRLNGYHLI